MRRSTPAVRGGCVHLAIAGRAGCGAGSIFFARVKPAPMAEDTNINTKIG